MTFNLIMSGVIAGAAMVQAGILPTAQTPLIRLACIGDSITEGFGTDVPALQSYPAQLERMLGRGWNVKNFGVSATTLLHQGDLPYIAQPAYANALAFKPEVVVINFGANDSKHPGDGSLEAERAVNNWQFKTNFIADYAAMIAAFRQVNPAVKIYLCYPAPAFPGRWGINDRTIREEIIPMIRTVAKNSGATVVDLYTALANENNSFPDTVHPNSQGAEMIARTVFQALTGKPFQGRIPATIHSTWNGFAQDEFELAGHYCRVVLPEQAAPGKPWIWRPEFFAAFDQADRALLKRGYALAFMEMNNIFGSPTAMILMDGFYQHLNEHYGLSKKTTLFGFSRGGLYSLNWAARHPERVACIYLDAPVCDFKSWPAGRGKGDGSPADWQRLKDCYGFKSDDEALAYKFNPLDNLKPLSKSGIKILSVCGDADKTVPLKENTELLKQNYEALGGHIEVIIKHGCDHHPHSLENPQPIVDFVLAHN